MKYKILICDDADFMRALIKDVLTKGGYEIAGEAVNGNDAVEKYKALKPDLVTMDIVMPAKSGIDALKEIIAYDPNAKVVMCSALGQEILVMDAIEAGAKDFIVKPFTEENVLEVIGKVLNSEF
jgi:two-component system chemotaxis response regulator CheY